MKKVILSATFVFVSIFLFIVTTASKSLSHFNYSKEPLSVSVRNAVDNIIEFTAFNNWLNANYRSLTVEKRKASREHLFSIIDSKVKSLYNREGIIFPQDSDFVLTACFAWATRIGVYGANSVLRELDSNLADSVSVDNPVPSDFKIQIQGDMIKLLSTSHNWSVFFPYYFMIGNMKSYRTTNELQTELVSISTGFGLHSKNDGHSQATILIAYSPEATHEDFQQFWLKNFGLGTNDVPGKLNDTLDVFSKLDSVTNISFEIVFPNVPVGKLVVAYLGVAGTFETNRPHFLDFLATIQFNKND